MLSAVERAERRHQIGASEVYKLFNFDTKGVADLWEEKLGLKEPIELENDSIIAGNILEEPCLHYFAKEHKYEGMISYGDRVEHRNITNFVASMDALITHGNVPVENKTVGSETYKKWNGKVPRNYFIQVQSQLACSSGEMAYVVINIIDEEEKDNPLSFVPSDLTQKVEIIYRDDEIIREIESRVKYMLWCITFKRRPSENDYFERVVL